MKKFFFPVSFAFVFLSLSAVSCSRFTDALADGKVQPVQESLVISDGKYLSSDTADDITPFYYHDTNGNRNFLFFSSDRDGSFDIFYAEMNADGSFQDPVKMGTNINTTADEFSPVVFFGPYNVSFVGYGQFISYLRVSAGQTNLAVVRLLGTNFTIGSVYQTVSNANYTRLSIFNQTNVDGSPVLLCGAASASWIQRSWGVGSWGAENTNTVTNSSLNIFALNGYHEEWVVGANQSTNYYLLETPVNGKRQLYLGRKGTGINHVEKISLYSSCYNDRDPDIDLFTKKVYFSSDRRGTYDLYRYNVVTFDKVNK